MSTKKTIQINPELFKLSGNRTKKREPKVLDMKPVISPNNLKNKLLNRIKEHKTKELTNKTPTEKKNSEKKQETYTDEFYGAINYLSDLTKKQKQQTSLNNKTLKNYSNSNTNTNTNSNTNTQYSNSQYSNSNSQYSAQPFVSLELPTELLEPIMPMSQEVFNVNYKTDAELPYGCLKNGKKKTYRQWREINEPPKAVDLPDIVRPPTPPKKNTNMFLEGGTPIVQSINNTQSMTNLSREQRLEQIKHKLKMIQEQENATKSKGLEALNKFETEMNKSETILEDLPDFEAKTSPIPDIEDLISQREEKIESETPKNYLKKTIKRKFTLGKIHNLRKVSVLIKDKQTRKNIINTQKELKKTNMTDVRKYLRQHGIIKVGSTCPPDILRKTFEAAMLAGEVTNTNKETLIHNFLHDDNKT
jgi:hypothetical protein